MDPKDKSTLESDYNKLVEFSKTVENPYLKSQLKDLMYEIDSELEDDTWDDSGCSDDWDDSGCSIVDEDIDEDEPEEEIEEDE